MIPHVGSCRLLPSTVRSLLWGLRQLHCSILPDLHISLQVSLSQFLPLALQDVFQGAFLIHEDAEMVTDDMSVAARRTGDQYGAFVIAMLGHYVRGTVSTGLAGKCDLIRRLLLPAESVLLCVGGIFSFG